MWRRCVFFASWWLLWTSCAFRPEKVPRESHPHVASETQASLWRILVVYSLSLSFGGRLGVPMNQRVQDRFD